MNLHKALIANEIFGDGGSGGGGSSDFSTATLTIDNQSSVDLGPQSIPVAFTSGEFGEGSPEGAFPSTLIGIHAHSSAQYTVILYKGTAVLAPEIPDSMDVRLSGDIIHTDLFGIMTGDATITISDMV